MGAEPRLRLLHDVMPMTSTNTDSLYTIDRTTGLATLVGPLTGSTNSAGLAYDYTTQPMFLIDNLLDQPFTVDLATGLPTLVGSAGAGHDLARVSARNRPPVANGTRLRPDADRAERATGTRRHDHHAHEWRGGPAVGRSWPRKPSFLGAGRGTRPGRQQLRTRPSDPQCWG